MRFADISGHDDVKQRLRDMVDENRMPHAIMIEGPEGSAKFALARAFLQYIHCTARSAGDSCGRCPECKLSATLNHIDTFISFPVVKRSGRGDTSDDYLAEFRDYVRDYPYMDFEEWLRRLDNINAQPLIYVSEATSLIRKLSITSRRSDFKTSLIWLPERLKEDAANKLLKLVEEPASDTIIVMVSNNSQQVLPTIYSRTQRVMVRRYTDAEVAEIISRKASMSEADAAIIARLSNGNINEALRLVSVSKERKKFLEFFINLMRKAYQRKIIELRQWSTDLAALGREPQIQFYEYCSRMLRENFVLNLKAPDLVFLTTEEMQFSVNFARFITNLNVMRLLDTFGKAATDIAANANSKIVNFDVAIQVILLLKRD
ncbi:MAG: DNA polymerase III subunit delta [Muribaculaceae bacterium]|nr:DNA polymerase III subunit delta [Muribaculaceae bacterium]